MRGIADSSVRLSFGVVDVEASAVWPMARHLQLRTWMRCLHEHAPVDLWSLSRRRRGRLSREELAWPRARRVPAGRWRTSPCSSGRGFAPPLNRSIVGQAGTR